MTPGKLALQAGSGEVDLKSLQACSLNAPVLHCDPHVPCSSWAATLDEARQGQLRPLSTPHCSLEQTNTTCSWK